MFVLLLLGPLLVVPNAAARPDISRRAWELTGDSGATWTIRDVAAGERRAVRLPTVNEQELADDRRSWDGIAEYEVTFDAERLGLDPASGERWEIQFDAVATEAIVESIAPTGDATLLGKHLGGWTPFAIDVTKVLTERPQGPWTFRITVDEKIGHNTQGFLPIIEPHFGGIWQPVRLVRTPDRRLDPLRLTAVAIGDIERPVFRIDGVVLGAARQSEAERLVVRRFALPPGGSADESSATGEPPASEAIAELAPRDGDSAAFSIEIAADAAQRWSPEQPWRHRLEIELQQRVADAWTTIDSLELVSGWRRVETDRTRLLLDGRPLAIRGILNWGYSSQRLGPNVDPEQMRQELDLIDAWGFNLIKCCLWVPPKRLLEMADERGILVWMEYPTWHPTMTPEYRDELLREYDEFYRFDASHPSVILRSLTCETGHGADESILRALYDLGKERIPGAIIEDDSSWIEWHRIHDFYDDHPYGNNHTWPATVARLGRHVDENRRLPLMLGEAIAADTWFVPPGEDETPAYQLPGFAQANREFESDVARRYGPFAAQNLVADSLRYALLMRKYQIETYRRLRFDGGYVVSVVRDFPLAGMGLIDYRGKPKWSADEWAWHGDTLLSLATEGDRRSFVAGDPVTGTVVISHHGSETLDPTALEVTLGDRSPIRIAIEGPIRAGERREVPIEIDSALLANEQAESEPSDAPFRRSLAIRLLTSDDRAASSVGNAWDLWFVPRSVRRDDQPVRVRRHASWDLPIPAAVEASDLGSASADERDSAPILARRFDRPLLDALERGAKVVMVPDGEVGSFGTRSHWFLRGAPIIADRLLEFGAPREFWTDLQHFDLAGDVIGDWEELDRIEPLLSLWDNHDIKQVKTHLLVARMSVGQGELLVSALPIDRPGAAGAWVLQRLIDQVGAARRADEPFGAENLARLQAETGRRELRLDDRAWKFATDPERRGGDEGFSTSEFDDTTWSEIRIDSHWEGQGHPNLDGWAWYRTRVTIPDDWDSATAYLSFTGVDDHYVAYVDGERVGTGGIIETKQTAFEDRTSHDISHLIRPGAELTIAIEVYDWYGAGGIFRPISITTAPLVSGRPWLK